MTNRPILVIEDDLFARLLQAFLDANEHPERSAAIADFVAHDIPDYADWLANARADAPGHHPAEVRLASSHEDLRAALRGADTVVTPRIAAQPRFNAFGDLAEVMAGLARRPSSAAPGLQVRSRARRLGSGIAPAAARPRHGAGRALSP